MPDDLPEVSPDLNAPLPTVDPNSQLVPYRMSRTDPGGQPVVTTGYGPRARPIQPPDSFNLDRIANAAFSQLPVDEASKAVEAASRYLGQRGYQKDLQSGINPAQAFAKWAPMMFRTATGIPEAMKLNQPQIQPRNFPGMGVAFGDKFYPQKPAPAAPRPTASVQLVDAIQEAERQAGEAAKSGDKQKADQLKERANLLREQAKGQQGISMEFGPGGTLQSFSTGGGQKPTIATATQAQENLVKYKNSLDLMNELEKTLKPEHVGVRGVAGEFLVDKGLQQAAEAVGMPDVANKDRITSRDMMVALREGLMRQMNDTARFSKADRDEIAAALPSSGVFESYAAAKRSLGVVRKVLSQRSRNYASQIGRKFPIWTLSPDEFKQQFPTPQSLVDAVKQGKVDKKEAEDAMVENF